MKSKYLVCFVSLLFCITPITHGADEPISVAVFDFESTDEATRGDGPKVATLVNANLSAEPQIITVERAELAKVLGEQELNLSGAVNPDAAVKIGHLTGAKVLVTGRMFSADHEILIVAKIIGTETSRVYGEIVRGNKNASLPDLCQELAKKVAADVSQKGDSLVAKTLTLEDRVAGIKKALQGKSLPTVSVHISESHFGQRVVDPAAETEFGVILQQCGFTLVDDHSTNKANVEITGDAFSAYGLRKGNLISCKGRVELKALSKNGDVLAVDRQTSVAIDLAEQTAAKTALQNAAAELAERVLPKLAQ
jgi:hypothetical protein